MRRNMKRPIVWLFFFMFLFQQLLFKSPLADEGALPTEDIKLVQELALRLLSPPVPNKTGRASHAKLLPGRLPDTLPLTLPVPPESRIVGTLVPDVSGQQQGSLSIILDVPGRPSDIGAFYEEMFVSQGWKVIPENPIPHQPKAWLSAVSKRTTALDRPNFLLKR